MKRRKVWRVWQEKKKERERVKREVRVYNQRELN